MYDACIMYDTCMIEVGEQSKNQSPSLRLGIFYLKIYSNLFKIYLKIHCQSQKKFFQKGGKSMNTTTMEKGTKTAKNISTTQTIKTVKTVKTAKTNVRTLSQIGMLAAIATVLMLFEIPLPFAPNFYEIDFSEVPVLVGGFAIGPMAAMMIELVKIILNLLINGTVTAGVGEIANFIIGCSLCVSAGIIYRSKRTRKSALLGMTVGTVLMTILGCLINAYVLLPTYAKAFHMPIEKLIEMGSVINPRITNLSTFVIFATAPFNLLKGILVSIIVFCIYKKISPIFKMNASY